MQFFNTIKEQNIFRKIHIAVQTDTKTVTFMDIQSSKKLDGLDTKSAEL